MTGFEPRISGIGSDRSTNCATTTALPLYIFHSSLALLDPCYSQNNFLRIKSLCALIAIEHLDSGPWWWSIGQSARLLLRRSEF